MKFRIFSLLLSVLGLAIASRAQSPAPAHTPDQQIAATPKVYKAAIFVTNRAGAQYDSKINTLEDFLTDRVSGSGIQVLSREVIANALTAFDPVVASAPRPADSLDAKLTEQSSALRLGQNLGADYLLIAAIDTIGSKERAIDAYGVKMVTIDSNLRATYKVIDGNTGATLTSDAVKATVSSRQTENARENNGDAINELLDQAAEQLGNSLKTRVATHQISPPSDAAAFVEITINVEAADLAIPDVRIEKDNTVAISESKYKVSPLKTTVELDGVALGTAPGKVKLRPGFSKLRLTREGFKPWERTINAVNGQTLTVAMELSADGYARWKETTSFLNDLKNGAKLTDAQVKVLEGQAKMLENSGFKVNTKEGITIKQNSIFGN